MERKSGQLPQTRSRNSGLRSLRILRIGRAFQGHPPRQVVRHPILPSFYFFVFPPCPGMPVFCFCMYSLIASCCFLFASGSNRAEVPS